MTNSTYKVDVGCAEEHLPVLLDRVEEGNEVRIVGEGKLGARLIPLAEDVKACCKGPWEGKIALPSGSQRADEEILFASATAGKGSG